MLDPFYPVVPDVSWVKRLVPSGTRLIQLRIKDQPSEEIGRQVREARDIGERKATGIRRGRDQPTGQGGEGCLRPPWR